MARMRTRELPLIVRWFPALLMMGAIFFFSSLPAGRVPSFGEWDLLIKKVGHASGYALLGLAYYFALPPRLSKGFRWILTNPLSRIAIRASLMWALIPSVLRLPLRLLLFTHQTRTRVPRFDPPANRYLEIARYRQTFPLDALRFGPA